MAAAPVVSGGVANYGFDDDLTRLVGGGGNTAGAWDGGNLGANYNAGFALIVPENAAGHNPATDSNFTHPDDLATSAKNIGTLRFDIDTSRGFLYDQVRFIIADFEEADAYTITLTGVNGTVQSYVASVFGLTQGNNFISQLPFVGLTSNGLFNGPLTGEALTLVEFTFNDASGAIATVEMIPEPSAACVALVGALAWAGRRRR